MTETKIKCVVVGDGAVGKTSLLIRYVRNEFSTKYLPTIFDNFIVTIPIKEELYQLHLFDTAGQEEYDQVRKLAFIDVDIFLVCFSIDLSSSLRNVKEKWIPELQRICPNVPFLLIATKIDLRNNENADNLITKEEGENLSKDINAMKYLECSSLTEENINEVFQEAVISAISLTTFSKVQQRTITTCTATTTTPTTSHKCCSCLKECILS